MKKIIHKLIHSIQHILGTNEGYITDFKDDNDKPMICFVCKDCKKISGICRDEDVEDLTS